MKCSFREQRVTSGRTRAANNIRGFKNKTAGSLKQSIVPFSVLASKLSGLLKDLSKLEKLLDQGVLILQDLKMVLKTETFVARVKWRIRARIKAED